MSMCALSPSRLQLLRRPQRCPSGGTFHAFAALDAGRRSSSSTSATTNGIHVAPLSSPADSSGLTSTWSHRAWVAAGFTAVSATLARSVAGTAESGCFAESLLAGLLGYILADLGTGFYHWAVDNYGGPSTPMFGDQIEAFQGHHKWPRTITQRQFANNLHALARAAAFVVPPLDTAACGDAAALAFIGTCAGCVVLSQQFHAWAHGTRRKLPAAVVALQDSGVLISTSRHGAHHRPPYSNNYCIVSGLWNELLDRNKVFEALEMAIFFGFGVRPRSWSEPSYAWSSNEDPTS